MGSDRGRDPLRIAARGHYRVTSGQSSFGDVYSHAASSTGDQPDCLTHHIPPASALPYSWSMTCSSGCLPPAGLRRQFGRAVAVVVRVQRYAWRYELIDTIQDLGVQRDVHRWELRLELFHGPRADNRRGNARVVDRPCQCEVDHRHSRLLGEQRKLFDYVQLALVRRGAHVEAGARARGRRGRAGGALAPPAGQPPTGQRAVHQGPHAVTLHRREHVLLDTADQDRVRGLLGDEPSEVPLAGRPLRLDDLAGRVGGRADVADLALVHEVGQRAEGLLDVCRRARAVYLVKIDVVRLQATQRGLHLLDDPSPRAATVVGPVIHWHEELRRQHDIVATPLQSLTDNLLRYTAGVRVGGVDEVDPGIEGAVNDADGVGAVVVAPRPEHHRAQAQRAHRYPGPAQRSVFHVVLLVACIQLLVMSLSAARPLRVRG